MRISYHSVLSHQDDTLSTEGLSDLVHLLRADIVNGDNEDAGEFFEETLELVEVAGLVICLAPHIYLSVGRMFKGQGYWFVEGEGGSRWKLRKIVVVKIKSRSSRIFCDIPRCGPTFNASTITRLMIGLRLSYLLQ